MGEPKALLPDGDGRPFVARVLRTFAAGGVGDVTVVTGPVHERIVNAVAADGVAGLIVRFARNPSPERGQLSSLITGLDAAAGPGVQGVLMTLVDVPFVSAATVRSVIDAFARTGAPIVRPAAGAKHGHPVLFSRALFAELRAADPGRGAKGVVRSHAADVVNVQVEDEGALIDVDTRGEYDEVMRTCGRTSG